MSVLLTSFRTSLFKKKTVIDVELFEGTAQTQMNSE